MEPTVDGDQRSQPTIVKSWLKQIVHRLVSHSPRLICTQCNDEFFAAEIEVRVSRDGVREECPHCHAGSFRLLSAHERTASRPVQNH